jgi:hypothetical protein
MSKKATVKPLSKYFLLLFLAISGVAIGQSGLKDEAPRRVVRAHDPAMFVAASALYLNPKSSCATISKPLPPHKGRKPKAQAKNGRS